MIRLAVVCTNWWSWQENNATPENLISFYINGTLYSAVDGMNWKEWANSSYNTLGVRIVSNTVAHSTSYLSYNGEILFNTETIIPNVNPLSLYSITILFSPLFKCKPIKPLSTFSYLTSVLLTLIVHPLS